MIVSEETKRVEKRRNTLIKDGKRSVADKIRENCGQYLYEQGFLKVLRVTFSSRITTVLTELKPVVETESVKRAGQVYQVPQPLKEGRSQMLAIRQVLEGAKKRAGNGIRRSEARALERVAAYEDRKISSPDTKPTSTAVEKRNERYRQVKSNRVNAHLRQR